MVVGTGLVILYIHECRSLKSKRKVVKSVVAKMRNTFNVSASEVGANDIYKRAEIGFAMVGNDQRLINSKLDKLLNFIEDLGLAEVTDTQLEILHI